MSLFTKPINEISHADVVSFCEQGIAESINLDYKEDFPKDLEKVIAAFANTYGGMIIIGVKENADGRPLAPFEGMQHTEKQEDRITNILVSNIYPPIFPEIRVCPPIDGKTFIVIRISQSAETPHAIRHRTRVYLRTGNRVSSEELANLDQLEWLQNKRRLAELFRNQIQQAASDHFLRFSNNNKPSKAFQESAQVRLSFSPLFPGTALTTREKLKEEMRSLQVRDRDGLVYPTGEAFLHSTSIKDGVFASAKHWEFGLGEYHEATVFGLLYSVKQYANSTNYRNGTTGKVLQLDWIIDWLDLALEGASLHYKKMGYGGLIQFTFSISNFADFRICPPMQKGQYAFFLVEDDSKKNQTDDELNWSAIISMQELADPQARIERWIKIGEELTWAFGFSYPIRSILLATLKERNRPTLPA